MSGWLARFTRRDYDISVFVMSYRVFVSEVRIRMKHRACRHVNRCMMKYAYAEWERLCRTGRAGLLDNFLDEIIDDQSSVCVSIL